jgi:hypothetical protein
LITQLLNVYQQLFTKKLLAVTLIKRKKKKMGSGCCKTTKIADASLLVMQTQNEVATKVPYGYVLIYPGKP